MPYVIASEQPVYWTVGDPPVVSGFTEITGCTVTGLPMVSDSDPNAYLGKLDSADFPPLPDSGWLEINAIYDYQGTLVMVRQSHNRTIYPPADMPALFVVYRPDASGVLEWVVGEPVTVGMHRLYGGIEYVCLQAHVTQADWTPPVAFSLWQIYTPPPPPESEWTYPVAYEIGDIVWYGTPSDRYQCRQAHTSQAGWTPPAVPALWLRL